MIRILLLSPHKSVVIRFVLRQHTVADSRPQATDASPKSRRCNDYDWYATADTARHNTPPPIFRDNTATPLITALLRHDYDSRDDTTSHQLSRRRSFHAAYAPAELI